MPTSAPAPTTSALLRRLRDPARLAVLRSVGVSDAGRVASLDRLSRVAARALAIETVRVSLVDDEREFFCALSDTGEDALREAPHSHSICKHVVHLGEPLVIEDTLEAPVLAGNMAVHERGVRGYLGVPLVAHGQVLGSFCAVTSEPHVWSPDDLAIMQDLAATAAETLALCARRADELVVEALDRAVLACLPETGVLRVDASQTVVFAEGAGLRARGLVPETMSGEPLALAVGDALAEQLRPLVARALTGETVSAETAAAPGTAIAWSMHATPLLQSDGTAAGATIVLLDITARREAETARSSAETINALLFENLDEGILLTDRANTVVMTNASALRMLDTDAAGLAHARATTAFCDVHGQPLQITGRPSATAIRTGEPQLGVIIGVKPQGRKQRWHRVNAVPIKDADGVVVQVINTWSDVTALRDAHDRVAFQAEHDALTGLPNRAHLIRVLEAGLGQAREDDHDLGVLFIDLDRFKLVNDSLGHHAGDELLRTVAWRLSSALRHGVDTLGRIAGDEFVVIARQLDGQAGARALADRLLDVLREPVLLEGTEHVVNASIGVAIAPAGAAAVEDLLRFADTAMYRAKREGGAVARVFETEMAAQGAVSRLTLESALRQAIAQDELELHYQPIVRPGDGVPEALEALVRWRRPGRGLVPPGEFIPIAEQSGLIVEIGEWVLEEACRQIVRWRTAFGPDVPPVHVNLAARQLADATLPHRVADLLAARDLPARALGIEVTESMLMDSTGHGVATLAALRATGIAISLDDFGTGYSSLSRLRELPLDTLKIDRSFVAEEDSQQQTLLAAIVGMAHSLGLHVVAEGVETEGQLARLAEIGCDFVQGYLLARPAPAAELGPLV